MSTNDHHHVVVVGGGFAGLGCVRALAKHHDTVLVLAGPGAGYMTGTTVFVDGAIMMQSPGL